jgi:deoxyxylulose-5-phosphate synthase
MIAYVDVYSSTLNRIFDIVMITIGTMDLKVYFLIKRGNIIIWLGNTPLNPYDNVSSFY